MEFKLKIPGRGLGCKGKRKKHPDLTIPEARAKENHPDSHLTPGLGLKIHQSQFLPQSQVVESLSRESYQSLVFLSMKSL